jgi:hypothetical protein
MASSLFNRAITAVASIASRRSGPVRQPTIAESVSGVLNRLGPVGKLITAIVTGPGRTLRRDSEAEAAKQVLQSLNRLRYDRRAREAEEEIGRKIKPPNRQEDIPAPQPQTQPARTPPPTEPPAPPAAPAGDGYDNIQLLGRDAFYHEDDVRQLVEREHLTPRSSNVYSYVFERESVRTGILYVTFKAWSPGRGKSEGAGPTYAYYDVPLRVYQSFQSTAASSPGGAVWDYLRVRGSVHEHQYHYRIVAGTLVQGSGVYVPRKATRLGFKNRAVPNVGAGRRGYERNTLPEQHFLPDRARPDRGNPDRGRP